MSRATLLAAVGTSGPMVLDTSVVLSYLNGTDIFSAAATVLFDELVVTGSHPSTISAITVTETLVRPYRSSPAAALIAETFLAHFANLRVRDVDGAVARAGARLRATSNLRTPDALIVATAIVEEIPIIVACDDQWKAALADVPAVRLVHLKDHLPL